jgi:hypothetical protein
MDRTTPPDIPAFVPPRPRPTRPRRYAAVASLALLVGGLAACGDDDGGGDDAQAGAEGTEGGGTGTTAGGLEAQPAGGELDAYCTAVVDLEATAALNDPSGDPVAFAEAMLEPATTVQEVAPDEVEPVVADGVAILQQVVDTGDPTGLQGLEQTTAPLHEFDVDNCGWEVSDVTMADYSFAGLPDELAAGVHSFELANDGAEAHVLVVVRKAEGVTQSWDEILAAGEGSGLYEDVTSGFAPPGATGYAVADLAPGEYMALCPIPTGTTAEAEGSGPPHFVHGMTQEFTVA